MHTHAHFPTCLHIQAYTHTHTFVHTYTHTHTHTHIRACVYTHTHTCIVSWKFQAIGHIGYFPKYGKFKRKEKLLRIMCMQSSVTAFYTEDKPLSCLHVRVKSYKLQWCCRGDVMEMEGCVSRLWGRGDEGEVGTTCNENKKWSHSILMFSYRSSVVVGPVVAKCWKSSEPHVLDTQICTFTAISIQTGIHLVARVNCQL
jgi:hypothetical protein